MFAATIILMVVGVLAIEAIELWEKGNDLRFRAGPPARET